MLRSALIVTAAAAVFALSAGMLFGGGSHGAEAAKPQLVPGTATISSDASGNCVVTVTWSGLHGGKPMWVNTQLMDGSTQPKGGTASIKVRSGDGQVVVVYDGVQTRSVVQTADSVNVSFTDNRFNQLDWIPTSSGSC
jgi:hypothetical protein